MSWLLHTGFHWAALLIPMAWAHTPAGWPGTLSGGGFAPHASYCTPGISKLYVPSRGHVFLAMVKAPEGKQNYTRLLRLKLGTSTPSLLLYSISQSQ